MIKAITLYQKNNYKLVEYTLPQNCEDGIVIDIIACGICGTDGHLIDGKMELDYPIIPGHEFYGKVTYIGKNSKVRSLNGEIKIGDIVTVLPGKSCGTCIYCKSIANSEELCIARKTYGMSFNVNKPPYLGGGYAEKVYITGEFSVFHVPRDWPMGFGAILETMAVGVHAVHRVMEKTKAADNRNMTAVVIGAGAVGVSVIMALKMREVDIVVIEPIKARRDFVLKLGVKKVFSHYEFTDEWENSLVNCMDGLKPDIVVDAAGTLNAFESALKLVRRGGSVLELGNFTDLGEVNVKPSYICRNEITVVGSALAPDSTFFEAARLLEQLVDVADFLISPRYSLDEYEKGIRNLRYEKIGLKAVFVM